MPEQLDGKVACVAEPEPEPTSDVSVVSIGFHAMYGTLARRIPLSIRKKVIARMAKINLDVSTEPVNASASMQIIAALEHAADQYAVKQESGRAAGRLKRAKAKAEKDCALDESASSASEIGTLADALADSEL